MIFTNSPYLLFAVFLFGIIIQYVRYLRIAKKQFGVSAILIIKILIRSLIIILFIIAGKAFLRFNTRNNSQHLHAVFIIRTNNTLNFKLTDDDQTNISTKLASNQFTKFELRLYNEFDKQFYQYVPPTSENTFVHLLHIERPFQTPMLRVHGPPMQSFQHSKRIELYEISNNRWHLNDKNQEDFSIWDFLNNENTFLTPFLLQYLLILILCLLSLDIGIKYRILKM
jgi:hypothetical protein